MITLEQYLIVAAALFCIGLYGALTSKNALRVLISMELVLNAVNLNLAAFSFHIAPKQAVGINFVILLMVMAAAEVGLGLAVVLSVNRSRDISMIDRLRELRG